MLEKLIFGPPGCGKTYTLINVVRDALKKGTPPDKIGFVSFSRKSVEEARSRVAAELNLTEEDEVILPAFTIISPLSAVVRSGAKPVFCDVDKNTWNMTLENIKKKTTKKLKPLC